MAKVRAESRIKRKELSEKTDLEVVLAYQTRPPGCSFRRRRPPADPCRHTSHPRSRADGSRPTLDGQSKPLDWIRCGGEVRAMARGPGPLLRGLASGRSPTRPRAPSLPSYTLGSAAQRRLVERVSTYRLGHASFLLRFYVQCIA